MPRDTDAYEALATLVDLDEVTVESPLLRADTQESVGFEGRYTDLGSIGAGGMGEVRRVRDAVLGRVLAMKTVQPGLERDPRAVARLIEEARATAQLDHPHIVPIHDLGRLADGRVWFTMPEVHGCTLDAALAEVHAASEARWERSAGGWTFRRLITSLLLVCRAVDYAHERGVVHRDLKPENVMLGAHGEVYVLDWGLAKLLGQPGQEVTDVQGVAGGTLGHSVAGTPAFMAPEQARGDDASIDARTDVYALGATLYALLAGRAPYRGSTRDVLDQVLAGPPPSLRDRGALPLPEELVAACEVAMARQPSARFQTVRALAAEIEAWLDGSRKREQALALVEGALESAAEARQMRDEAGRLERRGKRQLEGVKPWQPESAKVGAWTLQDTAAELRREAALVEVHVDQELHGALRVAPDLPEAHAALAGRLLMRHAAAEAHRESHEADALQAQIQVHADALPAAHPVKSKCSAYLRGDGVLTLISDPPGAEVMLRRFMPHHRRLIEVDEQRLGRTPIVEVPLPMGSYVAVLRHPDTEDVRVPIAITRQARWEGTAPGHEVPTPIWMPPRGFLAPDEVYVAGGWFQSGGDPLAARSDPARWLWCHDMVFQRFPTTHGEFLAFLHDLVDNGRVDEAMAHAPRVRPASAEDEPQLCYSWDGQRFALQPDMEGDLWLPDWPVFNVTWSAARAYLAWKAARTGRPWRLPGELEWEKAARGVDGRSYPWGDYFEPSWCCTSDAHPDENWTPAVVDSFRYDVSPYGVRGVAGNVIDWCLDLSDDVKVEGERVLEPNPRPGADPRAIRASRGGVWKGAMRHSRLAARHRFEPMTWRSEIGFRGAWRPVRPGEGESGESR